jgi:limonene-1,2-epoxide hydrolase
MSVDTKTIDAKQIVERETQRWSVSYEELCRSFRDLLGDSAAYLCQQDMPIVTGGSAAQELIDGFHAGFGVETIEVEWVRVGQVGNVLWNERIDHMVNAARQRFLAIPISGFFAFDESGTLIEWRDYWDMRALLALAPAVAE